MITRILSEGASAGIHLIMTGDRSLLAGRIAALCEDKLVFKLAEKDDYALAGLRARELPGEIPPGRAFGAGSGIETQVALLAPDPSGQAQAAALRQIADWAAGLDAGMPRARRPFRVDLLPSRITPGISSARCPRALAAMPSTTAANAAITVRSPMLEWGHQTSQTPGFWTNIQAVKAIGGIKNLTTSQRPNCAFLRPTT